jgi:hypothetical protein
MNVHGTIEAKRELSACIYQDCRQSKAMIALLERALGCRRLICHQRAPE